MDEINEKLDALKEAVEQISLYLKLWNSPCRWVAIEKLKKVWDDD